jgi:molybdate transport system regulatory protein
MEIRQKIWFERDGKSVFGPGRKVLLQAIDECQSLNAAAKKLNMSYRAAWGRLKATEERLGMKLVRIDAPGGAMHLTDEARDLIEKFSTLEGIGHFCKGPLPAACYSVPTGRPTGSTG